MTEERDDAPAYDEQPTPIDLIAIDSGRQAASRLDLYGRTSQLDLEEIDWHFFHILIKTVVFERTSQRLDRPEPTDHMNGRTYDSAIARIKAALYGKAIIDDDPAVRQFFRNDGTLESKLLLLERIARSLGDDWSNDSRSFLDVTIAMGRLQLLLRKTMASYARQYSDIEKGSVLMTGPSGEAHHFGTCVLEGMFRSRGWLTGMLQHRSISELVEHLTARRYDIVCLSWSTGVLSGITAQTISAIDAMPPASRPAIIAGGQASAGNRGWMVRLGVDQICDTAYGAIQMAESLLAKRHSVTAGSSPPTQKEPVERAG